MLSVGLDKEKMELALTEGSDSMGKSSKEQWRGLQDWRMWVGIRKEKGQRKNMKVTQLKIDWDMTHFLISHNQRSRRARER